MALPHLRRLWVAASYFTEGGVLKFNDALERFVRDKRFRGVASRPLFVVDDLSGCWVWQRAKLPAGYGRIGNVNAHVVFYEWFVGPIPAGLEIDHLCQNKSCVNPEHLEAVTHAVNSHRRPDTKLTPEAVRDIRESSEHYRVLAERWGISPNHVYKIRNRRQWAVV